MNNNEKLIEKFYTALQKVDAASLNACYSNDIVFFDPMFDLLKGNEVRAMWEMLCKNAKDFSLEFDTIKDVGDGYYNCNWRASYNFSKTGRRVINNGKAYMKIENGLIIEHSDGWSFHGWSAQAIGILGKLLGWSSFFKNKVKNNARKSLLEYMQKNTVA
jgi:ketosteroid isomerase-like protein